MRYLGRGGWKRALKIFHGPIRIMNYTFLFKVKNHLLKQNPPPNPPQPFGQVRPESKPTRREGVSFLSVLRLWNIMGGGG